MPSPLLQLHRIDKAFGGVAALKAVDLQLHPGEILGLVGENGAGKSTLIKILCGVHKPDAGTMEWNGKPVLFRTPREAMSAGIATIHQELAYFAHLSVAENLLLGRPWPRHRWGGLDWQRIYEQAREQLSCFELEIPPDIPFHHLSAAQKQEVAIARALSRQMRLIVLDEPTASLSEPEVQRLFSHLWRLKGQGIAILYVSHRLDEILQLTDRVAVLRDGQLIAQFPTRQTTTQKLVQAMVGRSLNPSRPFRGSRLPGPPALELRQVKVPGSFGPVTLRVHSGEVVGLAGLVGSGRSALARAIYGLRPAEGEMKLLGAPWKPRHPLDSLKAGLVYIPEERKRQGLVLAHSIRNSLTVGLRDLISRYGQIDLRQEQNRLEQARSRYSIRMNQPGQPIGTISGGNQQKVLLARWLDREPNVILLNEPTRGVDVGAKGEIHTVIDGLARQGKAVLLISSDLPELLQMCDRILVMCRGKISAELRGSSMTQENVILAASGLNEPAESTAQTFPGHDS